MMQLIFRNWKIAALWVFGVLASTSAFFAEGGGHEQLDVSAKKIKAQSAQLANGPQGGMPDARVADGGDGFSSDEEIDPELWAANAAAAHANGQTRSVNRANKSQMDDEDDIP